MCTFSIDQFPNRVGSKWVYETYDSSTGIYDTLLVSISDTTTIPGGERATIWEYDYGSKVDTQYVVLSGNRIEFHSDTSFRPFDLVYYEFSLAVGRYWGIESFAPVPEVIEKGPVGVRAGTFECGFRHVFSGGAFNYHWHLDDWLVPRIGLVYRTRWVAGWEPFTATTWELLSYSIAE